MLRKRRPSSDESTAHHEAGHVLVGHLVGFDISGSTIEGSGSVRGYTLRHWHKPQGILGVVNFDPTTARPPDESPLLERLIMLYAGVVAQRLLCERRGVSTKPVRLGYDIREARDNVRHLPKTERIELLSSAEKRAMELLSDPQHWQLLEGIAAKLIERRTLDGPSLLELLSMRPIRLSID